MNIDDARIAELVTKAELVLRLQKLRLYTDLHPSTRLLYEIAWQMLIVKDFGSTKIRLSGYKPVKGDPESSSFTEDHSWCLWLDNDSNRSAGLTSPTPIRLWGPELGPRRICLTFDLPEDSDDVRLQLDCFWENGPKVIRYTLTKYAMSVATVYERANNATMNAVLVDDIHVLVRRKASELFRPPRPRVVSRPALIPELDTDKMDRRLRRLPEYLAYLSNH